MLACLLSRSSSSFLDRKIVSASSAAAPTAAAAAPEAPTALVGDIKLPTHSTGGVSRLLRSITTQGYIARRTTEYAPRPFIQRGANSDPSDTSRQALDAPMAQGSAASASSPRKGHGADEPKPRSPRTVMVVDRISASPTVLEYERSLSAGRLSSDSATATASNDSAQAQLRVTRHGDELSSSADDEHGQRIPLDDDDRKIVSDGRMAGDHDDDESSHSSDASDSDGEGDENDDDDDESTDDDGGDDEEDRDGQQEDFGLLDPVEVNDQRWSELSFDPFEEPDSPLNIILGAPLEGDDQPSIEAATVHKLIQRCTNHQVPGFDFLNTFVLMFEYASSSPADLMQLLAFRFDRVTTVPAAYSGEQIKTWERTYKLPRILRVINFFKVCHESQTKSTTSRERERERERESRV